MQRLIERQRQLEDLVSRPVASEPPTDPLAPHYNLEALRLKLEQLHPADVAHILEALPLEERLLVWDQVDG
ncbi:magnesium transporter, partial [Pseudomonas sp. MWU13-2860]